MWPFRKTKYVRASKAGVVEQATHDYVQIDGKRKAVAKPLVHIGQHVTKNQVIGKK